MMTNQLRELDQDNFILRKVHEEVPPKAEYSISEFGKTQPVLLALKTGQKSRYYPG